VTRFLMETQKAYMSSKMDPTIVTIHFDQPATDHMHGTSSKCTMHSTTDVWTAGKQEIDGLTESLMRSMSKAGVTWS
jgi:hypothetical protein